jgi:hypothetical protein
MVNIDDVNKQLQGIIPLTKVLAPSTIEYKLPKQATVTKLLFEYYNDLKEL